MAFSIDTRLWTTVMGMCLNLMACAHGPSASQTRLALVPSATLGIVESEGENFDAALLTALKYKEPIETVDQEKLAAALPEEFPSLDACHQSDECLLQVGQRVAADSTLSITLAGLDDIRLVRVRLFDIGDGVVVQDLQETVTGSQMALEQYAADLRQRLFPVAVEPWYQKWWVWTFVGVVVGTSVAVTFWALDQPEADDRAIHLGDL